MGDPSAGWSTPVGSSPDGGGGVSGHLAASDGVDLHYLRWSGGPSERPWAVVVFLHGIASHAGWFAETAADLSAAGAAVYAPDRRGSGRSGGRRGHLTRYARALDDLDEVLAFVRSRHDGTPVFLAASSWAAKLAVVSVALRRPPVRGLLLLGPGLLPTVDLSPARRAAVVAGHLAAPTARVRIPLTPELYTATPSYVDRIRADRLRLLTATAQFFWETGRLDRRRDEASTRIRLPLLVLQGDADAMMDVPATHAWCSRLPAEDKTYRSYPGAGHTLDFEPDRGPYVTDMLGWLADRARPGRTS